MNIADGGKLQRSQANTCENRCLTIISHCSFQLDFNDDLLLRLLRYN